MAAEAGDAVTDSDVQQTSEPPPPVSEQPSQDSAVDRQCTHFIQ